MKKLPQVSMLFGLNVGSFGEISTLYNRIRSILNDHSESDPWHAIRLTSRRGNMFLRFYMSTNNSKDLESNLTEFFTKYHGPYPTFIEKGSNYEVLERIFNELGRGTVKLERRISSLYVGKYVRTELNSSEIKKLVEKELEEF